jgi:hypothetical protein
MRTKKSAVAVATCLAVAMTGFTVDGAAAAKTPAKHAKKAKKKARKRCTIVLVNGIHRCKGEHVVKASSSNSASPAPAAPVINNITINNVDNPPPAPAPAPAAPATATASATAPAPAADDKPGKGPKKDKGKSHKSH